VTVVPLNCWERALSSKVLGQLRTLAGRIIVWTALVLVGGVLSNFAYEQLKIAASPIGTFIATNVIGIIVMSLVILCA
jgi:hypothetical protein